MAWLFSVGSVMLLRREEEEGCVGDGIDYSVDDVAIDVLVSMHSYYLLFLKRQRKRFSTKGVLWAR